MSETMHILLVEDSPGEARLTMEALSHAASVSRVEIVRDGEAALAYLRRSVPFEHARRPDLILLDLNLPRRGGLEVLAEVKTSPELRSIPVIVLSMSQSESDVQACYENHANAYISKPVDLDQFLEVARAIDAFWLSTVRLAAG